MDLPPASFFRHFTTACLLCHTACPAGICTGCASNLPWIPHGCRSCGLPLVENLDSFLCGECQQHPSPFARAVIPLHYRSPINTLVTRFKHHQDLLAGHRLGELLAVQIRHRYREGPLPDLLVPVPLHWRRRLLRGFNQSEELGKQLSKMLGIPCCPRLARRVRATTRQQALDRQQRLRNLMGGFSITRPLHGEQIALLDDVVTTGSTARALAESLLQHGASEIHLWALARTSRENG